MVIHNFLSYSNFFFMQLFEQFTSNLCPSFPTLLFSSLCILFIWLQDSFQDTIHTWFECAYKGKVLTAFCKYCLCSLILLRFLFLCMQARIWPDHQGVSVFCFNYNVCYFMHVHECTCACMSGQFVCLFCTCLYLCVLSVGRKRVGPQRLWKEQGRSPEEKA